MIELNNEVLEKILSKETAKTEDLKTILRAIYTRTMRLYEKYFQDLDALSNDVIEELKQYNEETRSLVKYYYLDIPQDISEGIKELENTVEMYQKAMDHISTLSAKISTECSALTDKG